MPKKSAKAPKKSLEDHCAEVAAIIKVDPSQVRAVLDCDKITMPESHPVTGRILSELSQRGLTPSPPKKE